MSGELDAAGAAATAGLVVGAMERKDPAAAREAHGGACPNCGATLNGRFCHECGQPAHISRSLFELVRDVALESIHFDTRAWRTLPQLFLRPGTLTHSYIHGRRTRYVSPLGLFLLSIFFLFFVFESFVAPAFQQPLIPTQAIAQPDVAGAQKRVERAQAKKDAATADMAAAETKAASLRAAGGEDAESDAKEVLGDAKDKLREAEADLREAQGTFDAAQKKEAERAAALARAKEDLKTAQQEIAGKAPAAAGAVSMAEKTVDAAAKNTAAAAGGELPVAPGAAKGAGAAVTGPDLRVQEGERWQDRLRQSVLDGEFKFNSSYPRLNDKLKQAALNADLAIYKLQQAASHYAFLLIPISLPFLAFMFMWKRGVTLFDHAVFSLYSLSFVSLLAGGLLLVEHFAGEGVAGPVGGLFTLAVPVHLFFQFKGAYALGWWSALWRTMLFCFFAIFTLIVFVTAIIFLGIVT